jgi:hypothetical protein
MQISVTVLLDLDRLVIPYFRFFFGVGMSDDACNNILSTHLSETSFFGAYMEDATTFLWSKSAPIWKSGGCWFIKLRHGDLRIYQQDIASSSKSKASLSSSETVSTPRGLLVAVKDVPILVMEKI